MHTPVPSAIMSVPRLAHASRCPCIVCAPRSVYNALNVNDECMVNIKTKLTPRGDCLW